MTAQFVPALVAARPADHHVYLLLRGVHRDLDALDQATHDLLPVTCGRFRRVPQRGNVAAQFFATSGVLWPSARWASRV